VPTRTDRPIGPLHSLPTCSACDAAFASCHQLVFDFIEVCIWIPHTYLFGLMRILQVFSFLSFLTSKRYAHWYTCTKGVLRLGANWLFFLLPGSILPDFAGNHGRLGKKRGKNNEKDGFAIEFFRMKRDCC
jgi:hypothetical protein